MKFVQLPNLPDAPVKLAVVDGRMDPLLEEALLNRGIQLLKTKAHPRLQLAVSFHPDMMLHHVGENAILYAPDTAQEFLSQLSCYDFDLTQGETALSSKYPHDIAYNIAIIGQFAFHNTRYTDPVLKKMLFKRDIQLRHVPQGYAKCSVAVIDHNSIITSDHKIAREVEKVGIEALLLEPDRGIRLEGLDYGFIGGSSGLVDQNVWAIAGNAQLLKGHAYIDKFLKNRNMNLISLASCKVMDIGSIIPLMV